MTVRRPPARPSDGRSAGSRGLTPGQEPVTQSGDAGRARGTNASTCIPSGIARPHGSDDGNPSQGHERLVPWCLNYKSSEEKNASAAARSSKANKKTAKAEAEL